MDRRVKERLIGATILVVLIVLIVPELLSGPKRSAPPRAALSLPVPTRSVSVDLATSKATASAAADAASATAAGDDGGAAPGGASALSAPSAAAPDAGAAAGSAPANDVGDAAPTRSDQPPSTAPTVTTLRAQAPAPALESHASTPKSAVEARKPSAVAEGEAVVSSQQHSWAVQLGSFANKENAEKLAHQLRAQRASVYVISSGSGPSLRYRVRVGPLRDREAAERAIAKLKSEGHPATLVAP